MNAGGVPNTCKSNGRGVRQGPRPLRRRASGGRVSNAWATCPVLGDNTWKQVLIPHKRAVPHGTARKTPVVQDGPASD